MAWKPGALWSRMKTAVIGGRQPPAWMLHVARLYLAFSKRFDEVFFAEQSSTTRVFFGVVTFFFGVFFANSPTVHHPLSEYQMMMMFAPDWVWAGAFLINGAAITYGGWTNKYSTIQFFLEGYLGVVWLVSAYCVTVTQHSLGAHAIGAAIAFWVYIRYPTHWKGKK